MDSKTKFSALLFFGAFSCMMIVLWRNQNDYRTRTEVKVIKCPDPPESKIVKVFESSAAEKPASSFLKIRMSSKEEIKARGKIVGETCDEIFDKWMLTSKQTPTGKPPKEVPANLWNEYTLFGRIPTSKRYFDERSVPKATQWNDIDENLKEGVNIFKKSTYGTKTRPVLDAMTHFNEHFKGKSGAVIGSQRPWAEIFALRSGAASILTMEYQEIKIKSEKAISWIHPFEVAKNWTRFDRSFDFIISFSSIEHSGLGRYGDPLDPWGDLREMAKVRCLLKDNGVMILGFPVGDDALVWNAHRIYGPIRLRWMMQGFRLLGVFWNEPEGSLFTEHFPVERFNLGDQFKYDQPAIVLQKVEAKN